MRYQPEVSIQNLKQERTKKQRNRYSEALSLINNQGTFHLLQNGDILTCYEHGLSRKCHKLMKCPLILARELSPSAFGHGGMRYLDPRRIYDAVLYARYGESYENPRSHFEGCFQPNFVVYGR